jgi:hypothetical protein
MTKTRLTILALAAVMAVGLGTNAYAFHSGGVAECSGCHSMHSPYPAGSNLLVGKDASSACLACHQNAADTGPSSYHVSTADSILATGSPLQRTPGGDFGWLKKTYTWAGRGGGPAESEPGQTHGHNIIATSGYSNTGVDTTYGYVVDPDNPAAPGGTYPSTSLSCVSCHDMHGQSRRNLDGSITTTGFPIRGSGSYNNSADPTADLAVGVYRILAGPGYQTDGVTFAGVPAAVAPSTYNQTEATNQVKVAYGRITGTNQQTWSQWCGTCHGDMHYDGGTNYVHPTDETLGGTIRGNYNSYKKTGDLTGAETTAFTSLVPLVYNGLTYADLKTKAGNGSPTYEGAISDNDRVDCLSCHRAHASGWEYALRWNPEYEFLTDSNGNYYNGSFGGRGRTIAEVEDSYYDRPSTVFAKAQRSLCNKCHVKD